MNKRPSRESLGDRRRLAIALVCGLAIVLASGAIAGRYSQRWGPADDLAALGDHLATLPVAFGDWRLEADETISDGTVEMLQCAGYINRRYSNRVSGQVISMAILVGPAGPIAVHTPEICFSSRAYELRDERLVVRLPHPPDPPHTFWVVDFIEHENRDSGLRVYYAWSSGEQWTASESPRLGFAGAPWLLKIQLACQLPESGGRDAGRDFLEALTALSWSAAPRAGASRSHSGGQTREAAQLPRDMHTDTKSAKDTRDRTAAATRHG